tara:strand:- start:78 stop:389 length:312 start_codon:yes stop_codon:yes gene_type:complete
MVWAFLFGFFIVCFQAWLSFHKGIHANQPAYYSLGISFNVFGAILWYWVARHSSNIYFSAVAWDSMVILTFFIFPVIFMGVKVNCFNIIGVIFVAIGLFLVQK